MRIAFEELCRGVAARLQLAGMPPSDAAVEARIMAEADLQEVPSHGVRMLPTLLAAIAEGRLRATPHVTLLRQLGATCVVDCHNGPGRSSAIRAMDRCLERAETHGVGVCVAKNASHWGRAHAYAAHAAFRGYIGVCTTNGIPTMLLGGAKAPVIGNNPLAIAIPQVNAEEPVVLDMAMSAAAMGKVATWQREGRELPSGWGVDSSGQPSTRAQDVLRGALNPLGEHKGGSLAVMMELLTATLAGAAFSQQLGALDSTGADSGASKLFIALNVEAFAEAAVFRQQVSDYLTHLDGVASPFRYPGQRGWEARASNLRAGVPLHAQIAEQLAAVGVELRPLT